MEGETLTEGEVSSDAYELLLSNGGSNEGSKRPVKKVTRKHKREMDTKKNNTKGPGHSV